LRGARRGATRVSGHPLAGQPDAHTHHSHLEPGAHRCRDPATHRPSGLRGPWRSSPRPHAPLRLAPYGPPPACRPPALRTGSTMTTISCEVQLTKQRSAVRLCLPAEISARLGTARPLAAIVTINGHRAQTTLHKQGGGYMMAVN